MTVKQLKEKLNEYPDEMFVFIDERVTDFTYGLLNSVSMSEINFMEDPDSKPLSKDKVIILSEE